jgi:hypothetical protein
MENHLTISFYNCGGMKNGFDGYPMAVHAGFPQSQSTLERSTSSQMLQQAKDFVLSLKKCKVDEATTPVIKWGKQIH